jgi:hypothetical protein
MQNGARADPLIEVRRDVKGAVRTKTAARGSPSSALTVIPSIVIATCSAVVASGTHFRNIIVLRAWSVMLCCAPLTVKDRFFSIPFQNVMACGL